MSKKQFEDPLRDIDPIMEQAYSVQSQPSVELSPDSSENAESKPVQSADLGTDSFPNTLVDDHLELDEHLIEADGDTDSLFDNEANRVDNTDTRLTQMGSINPHLNDAPSVQKDSHEPTTPDNSSADFDISDIEFPNLDAVEGSKVDVQLFNKIPMHVSVELGRSQISLKEVFELSEGAIIELDRLVGEPLDLVVNGQVIAQGEVVAIDNNYGLRVTNIIGKIDDSLV
jgi:flagellar motor switch protein FliN/FliY